MDINIVLYMEHDALVYVEYILGNKEVLSNHKIYSETLQLQNVSLAWFNEVLNSLPLSASSLKKKECEEVCLA